MACDDCGGTLVYDEKHGEMVCSRCGAVSPELLPPPRDEGDPQKLCETASGIGGMGSSLRNVQRDGHGIRLTNRQKQRASALRRTHEIMAGSFTRYQRRTEDAVREMSERLSAADWIPNDALALHRRLLKHRGAVFPNRRALATALVVSAMRGSSLAVPLKDAADKCGIRFRDLVDALKRVRRLLPEARVSASIPALAQHFAVRLGHPELGSAARAAAAGMSAVNQNPVAVAAAACLSALRASRVRISVAEVARVAGLEEGHVHACLPAGGDSTAPA